MYIQHFHEQNQYIALKDLVEMRHGDYDTENLPSTCVGVYERGELIAFAALRAVEGKLAILEGLITNPTAPPDMRYQAIDIAVEHLTRLADQSGVLGIIAWSKDENTLTRSDKHGFTCVQQTLISRLSPNYR